jgi:hypothetical protein
MDTLISQLDQKYEKYRQNLVNNNHGDLDEDIFYNAYDYLCITEKQSKIKEILEKDRIDTNIKIKKIIEQNDLKEAQRDLIKKIEHNSFSFCYDQILRDVYIPKNKVKNSVNLLSSDEIIGETHIHWKEFWDTIYFILKGIIIFFTFTDRKDLDMNITLQKLIINFRQRKYSLYMESVHTLLIPHLLEIHTKDRDSLPNQNKKIEIIIDDRKGIYQKDFEQNTYEIKRTSKRLKLIKLLKTKECHLAILVDNLHQKEHTIITSISDINKLFREKADQSYDLILHSDSIGYYLNASKFEIKIKG